MQGLSRDVRRTVNYLRSGATVREVIHEKTHGFRREARARGRITRDDEVAIVRAYDSVTRGKQTRGADGGHVSLAFLPDGIADTDITDAMLDEAISEIMEVELMRMARHGSRRGHADSARAQGIGTASRVTVKNITAALKLLSPAAARRFSHFMEAARAYFGIVFGRTAAINKAERDGKFDREGADAFIDKLFGLDGQQAPDTPAAEALREILDVSPAAFSHRGVKPVPFAENVAKAIAGKLPANAILDFGTPGPVLLQAGVPDLPMLIRLGTIGRKRKAHPELTREILEALPKAMENPIAVFTSPGDGKAHGIVTSLATSRGPVTAYFTLRDFFGKTVLEAKSIYGRNPIEVLKELRQAQDPEEKGSLSHINKAAFETWAAQNAGDVSDAAGQHTQTLEDLRQFFADDSGSQAGGSALSLGPTGSAEILSGNTGARVHSTRTIPREQLRSFFLAEGDLEGDKLERAIEETIASPDPNGDSENAQRALAKFQQEFSGFMQQVAEGGPHAPQPGGKPASILLADRLTHRIESWKPLGSIVRGPEDIFALNEAFRNPWFKSIRLMAIHPESGEVIGARVHSIGTTSRLSSDLNDIMGFMEEIRGEHPGAELVISTNHPGGDPQPTVRDQELHTKARKLAGELGIPLADYVITNGTRGWSMAKNEEFTMPEGMAVKWAAAERSEMPVLQDTHLQRDLATTLRASNPDVNWVVYLDEGYRARSMNILPDVQKKPPR